MFSDKISYSPYALGESSVWISLIEAVIGSDVDGVWSAEDEKAWTIHMSDVDLKILRGLVEMPSNWDFPQTISL